MHAAPDSTAAAAATPRRLRRWLAALAVLLALAATAFWLLGREATLQQLLQRVANASGGQLSVKGARGSLYGRMHLDRLVYRGEDSVVTVEQIDINWSPLQYFSSGLEISELRIASVDVLQGSASKPAVLPATLAPPFRLRLADARIARLTVRDATSSTELSQLQLGLDGAPDGWRLEQGSAVTPFGQLQASATVAGQRPYALSGKASLAYRPAGQPPAALTLDAGGTLALLQLKAHASAGAASADASATLAPFETAALRTLELNGRDWNPADFGTGLPQAKLKLQLQLRANPASGQAISGQFDLHNSARSGPLDQQLLPLQALTATVGGTLAATRLDDLQLDLGAAGRFSGSGQLDAASAAGSLNLRTGQLDLHGLHSRLHASALAGEIRVSSAKGRQELAATLAQRALRLDLQATMADALLQLRQARLQARGGSLSITGQLGLKDRQPFKASASASHFDPSAFGAYPAADLNAELTASGQLAPDWQVAAALTLKPGKLLGQPLSGNARLQADARHLSAVEARLALGPNTAELHGSLGGVGDQLAWQLNAPQLAGSAGPLRGAVSASGVASGSLSEPRSSFEAQARGLGLGQSGNRTSASRLQLRGTVAASRNGPQLSLNGSAEKLDPADFGPYPAGAINGSFSVEAALAPAWRAAVQLTLQPSALAGAPLNGHARFNASAGRVEQADIALQLGQNSLLAKGGFGNAASKLEWKLAAPQLASLGPRFGGVLHAAGTLAGSAAEPALSLNLDGSALRMGEQRIASVRGSASLGGGDSVAADLALSGYHGPALNLNSARLQAGGTRGAHTLSLSAANDDYDATLRLRGGWQGDAWTGMLEQLQNRGRFALTLKAPAPLRLAGAPGSGIAGLLQPQQLSLNNAELALPEGSVRLIQLEKDGALWRSKGQASGVPANYLAQLSDDWRATIRSDLRLGANWELKRQGAGPAVAEGALRLFREQGDLTVLSEGAPIALGLRQLEARAELAAGTLRLQLNLDGSRAGQARAEASVGLIDGHVAGASALSASGSADMASLAWLAPLTGQHGLELDGAVKLAFTAAGSIAAPQLSGDISGDKLLLHWAEQGLRLRNGQLQARLSGDQLLLQKLTFDGDEGHASADGTIRFANTEASMNLSVRADGLQVQSRPDRSLVLSGNATLIRDARHFQLNGKLRADRANIELASQDSPTMSDDVVIVGRGAAAPKASPGPALNMDLEFDLGEAFRLRGKGLDAQLAGALRIRMADRRPPRVNGSIRVASGTYVAYGQKLAIERGVINFTGAYDNPGLNILAVRKRPEGEALSETNVEAGVEVRGTALAPVAKLVSTPAVSDSDKLAWLVLGHGMDSAAGNDMALLGTAAGALFGGGQGKLANAFGVDELGLSQARGLESTVVTVGKRLSARAYLSFEQGAGSATSLVKLRYKLNPRITLQFQTGTNNALDVLYTWAFD